MMALDLLLDNDAAIFLVLGLLAGGVLVLRGERTRERVVDRLLLSFLLFSGTLRFLVLFLEDLFVAGAAGAGADLVARLALAELAIAVLCLFAVRAEAPVPVRVAVVVTLAVVQLGAGVSFALIALFGADGAAGSASEAIASVIAGILGLVLLAFDWTNRTDAPDPLTPGGKRFTY